jgi:hypothetical protein
LNSKLCGDSSAKAYSINHAYKKLVQRDASTSTMCIEKYNGYLGMSYGTERTEAVKARTAPWMVATEDFKFL